MPPGSSIGRSASLQPLASRDKVDFDYSSPRQMGDTDGCAPRQRGRIEIGLVDLIHGRIVALEVREVDAHKDHAVEAGAHAFKRPLEVVHHLDGLGFDALRHRQGIVVRVSSKLTGDEQKAAGFDDMAVGRDGLGGAGNEMEEDV